MKNGTPPRGVSRFFHARRQAVWRFFRAWRHFGLASTPRKTLGKQPLFPARTGGRVAEGAPLLREYGVKSSIEGSNPSLSAIPLSSRFRPGPFKKVGLPHACQIPRARPGAGLMRSRQRLPL